MAVADIDVRGGCVQNVDHYRDGQGIRYLNLRTPDFPEPHGPGWFAISQTDYVGIEFDPNHRSGYWQSMLARHGAHRVETPGYSIFVYRLTGP